MSSGAKLALVGPPDPIPIFRIPELPELALAAIEFAQLPDFYKRNSEKFKMLVGIMYVAFIDRTVELRKKHPAKEKLFHLFRADIQTALTAAVPQRESFGMDMSSQSRTNGFARAFLWDHMRRQSLTTWQDFYMDRKKKNPKIIGLVRDFVHFAVKAGFEDGASAYVSDNKKYFEACRVIHSINLGEISLKGI